MISFLRYQKFSQLFFLGIFVSSLACYQVCEAAPAVKRLELFDGLGARGEIKAQYGVVDFAGKERLAVIITTPEQTLSVGFSGARVLEWNVDGMQDFVSGGDFDSGGFVTDLLWLPESARRSGDETEGFNIVELENDGREARVVFEAELRKAFPGVRLRKAYCVPATGAGFAVNVELFNSLVDEIPIEIAYWSHNKMSVDRALFVSNGNIINQEADTEVFFLSESYYEKSDDCGPEAAESGSMLAGLAYGEFFPSDSSGLVVNLPEGFAKVFRAVSSCGHEYISSWISEPASLAAGASVSYDFKVRAFPDVSSGSIKKLVSGNEE